jgi:hypothetical protein
MLTLIAYIPTKMVNYNVSDVFKHLVYKDGGQESRSARKAFLGFLIASFLSGK